MYYIPVILILLILTLIFISYIGKIKTEKLKKVTPPLTFKSLNQFFHIIDSYSNLEISTMWLNVDENYQPLPLIRLKYRQVSEVQFCYEFFNFSKDLNPIQKDHQTFRRAEIIFNSNPNKPYLSSSNLVVQTERSNVFDVLLLFGKKVEETEGYYKFEFKGEHIPIGNFIYEFIKDTTIKERWKLIISKV
ncbi:MAG: hypothetical protein V2A54_00460 [Bacteroidota bacterium]